MNETTLFWIAAVVIVAIGVAYLLWLALTYARFMETDKYVRSTVIKVTPEPETGTDE